jgi:hypothetical protein
VKNGLYINDDTKRSAAYLAISLVINGVQNLIEFIRDRREKSGK